MTRMYAGGRGNKRLDLSLTGRRSSCIAGDRFGKLIVQKIAERRNEKIYWLCSCDCGRQVVVVMSDLKKGRVKSCGNCPE